MSLQPGLCNAPWCGVWSTHGSAMLGSGWHLMRPPCLAWGALCAACLETCGVVCYCQGAVGGGCLHEREHQLESG